MKNIRKRIIKLIVSAIIVFFVSSTYTVMLFRFVNPPITIFMIYQYINGEHNVVVKEWRSIEEINPTLPLAIIASEDQNFLNHWGFDLKAIEKALANNSKNKRIRGGSTISQQLAKNLFLIPTKSYVRKALEGYFTILIELLWNKKRTMEVYLNVVEYGEGVYGASAAAKMYFGKDASELNQKESSLIVTALPNPIRYSLSRPSAYMYQRSHWVQRQMRNIGGVHLIKDWYE